MEGGKRMKIELGGGNGKHGRGPEEGFVNIDLDPAADIVHDLSTPLPLDDDSVDEVFSSHCLEHVEGLFTLLKEITRVCRVGARVVIIVPHWCGQMAMVPGHLHTISEIQVSNWVEHFPEMIFPVDECKKRFSLKSTSFKPSSVFGEAKSLFPHMTDDQIMRFIAGTCHETEYVFEVISNV